MCEACPNEQQNIIRIGILTVSIIAILAFLSLSILAPGSNTQWTTGETATISWSAAGSAASGTVTITLKKTGMANIVFQVQKRAMNMAHV